MEAVPSATVLSVSTSGGAYGDDDPDALDSRILSAELLVSGTAAGDPYTTRMLVRPPADSARFSGVVVMEAMHLSGGRPLWRALRHQLIRAGHGWAEVASQAPAAMGALRASDPERYERVHLTGPDELDATGSTLLATPGDPADMAAVRRRSRAFMASWARDAPQSPWILAQAAALIRSGATPFGDVGTIVLGGSSQSAGVVRAFIGNHHAALRRAGGAPVFDGYLPLSSGGDALPDIDVPVIEVLGESELPAVRAAHGIPGQATALDHRRPDSATFRLYEVAGMPHVDSRDLEPQLDPAILPQGAVWSRYPYAHVMAGALEALLRWVREGVAPAPGRTLVVDPVTGAIARDRHGNAVGGLRSPHVDVPTST
ncbi:MAG: alpha/beta hydrolase domain-containing protein, partial [Actinomycetota bacterium]|nr:alpha/beta hydrolase domain-containing protein [Actinomycetota bacterium]